MSEKTGHKHAIICSGGGADGAYEVGVTKAILNGKVPCGRDERDHLIFMDVVPQIFTGTSIGSFNATFLVSQWDEYGAGGVGNLEKVWLDVISKGGFRVRFNPFDYLNPAAYLPNPLRPALNFFEDSTYLGWDGLQRLVHLLSGEEPFLQRFLESFNLASFVSALPWEKTIRDSIDFKKVRLSTRQIFVAATNWVLGELKIFKNQDMTDKMGPAAIRASSAVPGFYPIATVGSQDYVDGAVLMNTPLSPAIKAGADVLHVIYMNNEVRNMPVDSLRSTLDTLYRTQIISWSEAINRDIQQAYYFNEGLRLLEKTEAEVGEYLAGVERTGGDKIKIMLRAMGQHVDRISDETKRKKLKQLTIHRYFPPDGLDGALGFLDISRQRIDRLIDEGFQDAINHDCDANGCIRPELEET